MTNFSNSVAGKLRALAVTTATRSDALNEFVSGYDAVTWYGVCAPKSTPAEIVEKLNREINAALADPKLKARLADIGAEPQLWFSGLASQRAWLAVLLAALQAGAER